MPLGKFVWKIKRKMNISSPSLFSARELFPGNRRPSSPLPFPRSAQQPRPAQQPRQATARAQPLTARARLSVPSSPPRDSATARACAWATAAVPLPTPGFFKAKPSPPPACPLAPRSNFSLARASEAPPSHGEAPPSAEIGTAVTRLPRAISDPVFPLCENPLDPLCLPMQFLACFMAV